MLAIILESYIKPSLPLGYLQDVIHVCGHTIALLGESFKVDGLMNLTEPGPLFYVRHCDHFLGLVLRRVLRIVVYVNGILSTQPSKGNTHLRPPSVSQPGRCPVPEPRTPGNKTHLACALPPCVPSPRRWPRGGLASPIYSHS